MIALAVCLSLIASSVPAAEIATPAGLAAPASLETIAIENAGYGPEFQRQVGEALDRFPEAPGTDLLPTLQSLRQDLSSGSQSAQTSAFVLAGLTREQAAAGLAPATHERLIQTAARIRAAAREDKRLAQAVAEARGEVDSYIKAAAPGTPAAVAAIPAHLKDWRIFSSQEFPWPKEWASSVEHLPDGSAAWSPRVLFSPLNDDPYTRIAKRKLAEVFPEYRQPDGRKIHLPPPHQFALQTAKLTGFQLDFPSEPGGSGGLTERSYLQTLSGRGYPMRDEHDFIDHWPHLFGLDSSKFADIAGTALGLESSPLAQTQDGKRAIARIQSTVGVSLHGEVARDRKWSNEEQTGEIAKRSLRHLLEAGIIERLRFEFADWAKRQGPFGRELARRLQPARNEGRLYSDPLLIMAFWLPLAALIIGAVWFSFRILSRPPPAPRLRAAAPEAPQDIPEHLRDWKVFREANWDYDMDLLQDGGLVLGGTVAGKAKKGLARLFPEIEQPLGDDVELPPPYKVRERALEKTGFDLAFIRASDERTNISEEEYLGLLAEKRYPLRDGHDLAHLAFLSKVDADEYAFFARLALDAVNAPWAKSGDQPEAGRLARVAIGIALDTYATPFGNGRGKLASKIAKKVREFVPVLSLKIAKWAARRGPLGRALALELQPTLDVAEAQRLHPEEEYPRFARLHERLEKGEGIHELEQEIPGLAARMTIAEQVSKERWAQATVVDELVRAPILSDRALGALGIERSNTAGVTHVPAGLMHTYGYLFSQLRTAYGLKGKRWIESRLDERLGLPPGSFSPYTAEGEFLANLTAALHFFTSENSSIPPSNVSPEVVKALREAPDSVHAGAIVEEVAWRTKDGGSELAKIYTHLLNLKPLEGPSGSEDKLLVYEIERDGERRFVTAFPVDRAFAESIMNAKPATGTEFKPRFNLYIDPGWKPIGYRSRGFVAMGRLEP